MALTDKIEKALSELLTAAQSGNATLAGMTIHTGEESADYSSPCVICHAQQGEEEPAMTGNYMMQALVIVDTQADEDDSETDHASRIDAVKSVLMVADLPDQMTAQVSGFTVYEPAQFRTVSADPIENRFRHAMLIEMLAVEADV